VLGYVLAFAVADFGRDLDGATVTAVLAGLWLPTAAWETSRKVRAAADETDYMTYSKLLGWKTTALVPVGFILASWTALAFAGERLKLGDGFPTTVSLGAGVAVSACVRFRTTGKSEHATLEPAVSLYGLAANLGLAVALVVARGVELA
jgi:hypothetical protein